MAAISDAIRAAVLEAQQSKGRVLAGDWDQANEARTRMNDALNATVMRALDNSFPQQLARHIQTVLPQIMNSLDLSQTNSHYTDEERTNINNSIDQALSALTELVQSEAFDKDLTNDTSVLQELNTQITSLQTAITTNLRSERSHHYTDFANDLEASAENIKTSGQEVQGRIDQINKENAEPEDISLNTKGLKKQLEESRNDIKEFRNSLDSLFNFHTNFDLSTAAKVFEDINKSAMSADEAIQTLHNTVIDQKLDSPESISGAKQSADNLRQVLEQITQQAADTTASIAQVSLGDVTKFYNNLLRLGSDHNVSLSQLRASINNLQISDSDRAELEAALQSSEDQLEALVDTAHSEFTTAFNKRIDSIIQTIERGEQQVLTQFAQGRGLGAKYTGALRQSGEAASSIWQIATGIEQTKDRFSLLGFGFGGSKNLHGIKRDVSIISQTQFELGNASENLAGLFDQAAEQSRRGDHAASANTKRNADKLFATIAHMQSDISARTLRAEKEWNSLSEKERKRLDPEGQMENKIRQAKEAAKQGNLAILQMKEAYNIEVDSDTKKQLKQLRNDTKDLTKIDEEAKKAANKTESAMNSISNFARTAYNEIRSIISSIRQLFNTFGVGTALMGPIETSTKLYEYHRKQGQARFAAMGTDAYIGYTDLDDSRERAHARLMAGNELYRMSGGRIDREVIDKQYQSLLRNVGGQYGSTPEQAVADAEFLTKHTALFKNVYGIDDSTMQQAIKTYYKDMEMSPQETIDALATLSAQAQAANIPLGQYLSKVSSIAQTFMQIGISGEQAHIILNQLLQSGVRMEVAEEIAGQVGSAAGKFAEDKNKIAFAAVMQGENPWHAMALAAYTHTADGKPREGWAREIGGHMDTYLNTIMMAYGNDPNMRRIGATDLLKGMGLNQRAASRMASVYLEEGNSEMFQQLLGEEMSKADNPNAKMEELSTKIHEQLIEMTGQLAESDRTIAELDSNLYREARAIGSNMDIILNELAPIIIEFQKQMLKFIMEALKFIQKLVTSDLFKEISNTIIETIRGIPDFLVDVERKIDSALGWIQSLIEGTGDKGAQQAADELGKDSQSGGIAGGMLGYGVGTVAGLITPGPAPLKIAVGAGTTYLFNKLLRMIQNAATEKDANGNLIKDANGNPKFKDSMFGNVMSWMSSPERLWNDANHPIAGITATMAAPAVFKSLGNINALSLTAEGIGGGARLLRGGARGLAAGLVSYLVYNIMGSGPSQGTTNIQSDANKRVLGISETLNQDILGLTTVGTVAGSTVTFGAIQRLISKIASPTSSLRGLRPRAAIGMLGVLGVNALADYLFSKDTTKSAESQETAAADEPSKQKADKDKSYFEKFLDLISSRSEAAELPANYDTTNPVESATTEAMTDKSSSASPTSQPKREEKQEEEKRQEDSISALTVLSSAAAATGAGVFALMLKNFVTHEELVPLIKNIASLFKAPFKDIFNILKNTWGVIKDIPKSIVTSIGNFGSTVRATPGTFKTKFGASTIGRWRLINKQYDYEKEIKRLTTERERLIKQIQNPNRLTRVDRIKKDLERVENALGRTTRAHSRVTEILESSKGLKWLPNRQELANIRRAENLLNASGRPGDVFRSSLKDIQNLDKESIQLNRKLARSERELANITARINNPDFKFMRSADITRQIELIAEQRNLKFDIKDLAARRKGLDGVEMYRAAIRQASGLGNRIVVNDIEAFIKTHGAISANELKRAKLVADAQALEAKILDRQTRMRGLNPNSQEFARLERELKNIRTVANNRNKAIKALDVKIQKLKANLGAQIKASTSTFNRITHNAFSESKRLINEISKGTKNLLKSVFDKTKKSIFDTAKSVLQAIGKVLGSQATNFLKFIGQRASALVEPFKKIFDGLKVLGRFLGLTDTAISSGAAETSILGKLKNAAKSAGKALLRIPSVKFMAELAKGAGEKVLNIGGRALKFMGKVAMPLAFASVFYDIYSYEQQSGDIAYAVEHAFRDNAAELALLGIALTGPVGVGIAGATAAIDILWRVATGHGALEELGQVTGLSIKATDEDKRKELVGILTQKYPELNDHPELIEKIVKKEISLDQALAFIAGGGGSPTGDASLGDGSIPDVNETIAGLSDQTQNQIMADIAAGTQDIQKLQEKYNLTDDQAAAVSQMAGLTPADKVPDDVSPTPPGQMPEEEVPTVPGYVPDETTDIDDEEEYEDEEDNSDSSDLTKEQRRQQRRKQRQAKNALRRQHNNPLAEAQRIAGLTNSQVSKEKRQELIESLITEHASRVDKDYKDMSKKIEDSSLTAEKKLEVKSALEAKYQHDLEQIESLRGKADTDEIKQLLGQVQNDYAKTNKNIEVQSGITYAALPERRDQRYIPMDIARRQYADPLFEASRIAELTDKQISKDRRKQLLGGLFDEHEQRIERDYQEMFGKINQSQLSEEKKQEAKDLLDAKHEKDLQHIKQLREETDNNNISALSEQVQDDYRKSSQAFEASIGINYEELPETREEADNSRKFHTTQATRKINEKQLESQRLQEITNATLEDFMDAHEKLMSMFQQTVTREHENIFKMIGITHQILMDLKQTFVRSGALIFAATVKGITSPGSGIIPNSSPTPQGTDDSAVAARRLTVFNHLNGANFSENAIAGILGNLHRESYGFDPTADNGTHHGIVQWDKKDRWPRIKQWIESHGGKADDLDWQVKAMLWEMKEVYGITPESFKPASIEEAVDYINKHYEVSDEGISERLNFANQDIAAVKQANQPASIGGARAAGVFDNNPSQQTPAPSGSGNRLFMRKQDSGNCTGTSMRALIEAYTGQDPGYLSTSAWQGAMNTYLGTNGTDISSREEWINSLTNHFKQNPNAPVMLYQTDDIKANGQHGHKINPNFHHAVVAGRMLSNGNLEIFDPASGTSFEMSIAETWDPLAAGGQGVNTGHMIVFPRQAPSRVVTEFGSEYGQKTNVPSSGQIAQQFAPAWGLTDLPNDSSYQFFTNYVQVNSSMSPESTLAGIYAKEFNQQAEDYNAKIREARKQQQSPPQSLPQAVEGAVTELPDQQVPPTDPKAEAARIATGEPPKSTSDEKSTGDKQSTTEGEKAQAGEKPAEKPKHIPFHNPFEDLVAKLIDINYTYNSDDSLYRERVFGETYGPQIIDQARKNKRFERPKIVAPQKPVEPQELSQEEIDKLTPEEKEKYEERIFNERLAYDQQLIEWKEYQKNKPSLWDILPSISDYDALTMANNQFKQQRLNRLSDEDLLKYFGIEVHGNIDTDKYTLDKDVEAIAKLIRTGKDLQGNKITEEQIQKLMDTGLNKDQALAKIYENTNSFKFANFTGKVQHISELFNISHKPDFLERSKNLKRAHIKRKKQESSEAPVHVQGYERGQQVDFWTDEIGAETFYRNQLDLYKTANGFSYKDSAFYDKLFNEYKQNILKGEDRDLTPRERAQIEAEVGARMSTWAEFNMTGREYAQYMGYEINGDVPDKVYDELLLNAALGKSPNGKDYMEAIDQAKDEILKILDGSLKTTDEELEQIRSRLEGLEVSSAAYQDALIMLARQRVPKTKYEEFGEITDDMGSGGFGKTNHNYEALRDPEGRQSLYQSTGGMLPMALGTYMGGLWGEYSRSSYGGMTGYQFLKQLQMNPIDPNGPPLVNWDFDMAAPFNDFVLGAREHFGKAMSGGKHRGPVYEVFWGSSHNANTLAINKRMAGLSTEAHDQARTDRRDQQFAGKLRQSYAKGNLEIHRAANQDGSTNYDITSRSGGHLTVNLRAGGITGAAMKGLVNAIQEYFKEHGDVAQLFEDLDIKSE